MVKNPELIKITHVGKNLADLFNST